MSNNTTDFDEIAEQQGWNDDTRLDVMRRFIGDVLHQNEALGQFAAELVNAPHTEVCRKCDTLLTPIDRDDEDEVRLGINGELRCADLTCPYSDRPQTNDYTEG